MTATLGTIAFEQIYEGENFSRGADGYYGDLEALARGMRESLVVDPFVVRGPDRNGCFELVAGFRRFRAYRIIAERWPDEMPREVPAIIYREITDGEAAELNCLENTRLNPTTYERIMALKTLKLRFGRSSKQLAERFGMSVEHVDNLVRVATRTHPTILEAVKNGHPIKVRDLVRLSAKEHDDQLEQWEARKRARPNAATRARQLWHRCRPATQIAAVRDELRVRGDHRGAIVLEWVLGERETV